MEKLCPVTHKPTGSWESNAHIHIKSCFPPSQYTMEKYFPVSHTQHQGHEQIIFRFLFSHISTEKSCLISHKSIRAKKILFKEKHCTVFHLHTTSWKNNNNNNTHPTT